LSAALLVEIASAAAQDEPKCPDLRGQWTAIGGSVKYVPDKPRGLGQEAPLTPEYQAIFEANLRHMAEGGQGTDPTTSRTLPWFESYADQAQMWPMSLWDADLEGLAGQQPDDRFHGIGRLVWPSD
jgi:hypothetical protein